MARTPNARYRTVYSSRTHDLRWLSRRLAPTQLLCKRSVRRTRDCWSWSLHAPAIGPPSTRRMPCTRDRRSRSWGFVPTARLYRWYMPCTCDRSLQWVQCAAIERPCTQSATCTCGPTQPWAQLPPTETPCKSIAWRKYGHERLCVQPAPIPPSYTTKVSRNRGRMSLLAQQLPIQHSYRRSTLGSFDLGPSQVR